MVGLWVYGLDNPEYKVDNSLIASVRQSQTNIKANKEDQKAQMLNNPYLWATCIKFFLDDSMQQRFSASSNKSSFVIVHFSQNSSSPQFLEFKIAVKSPSVADSTDIHKIVNHREEEKSSQPIVLSFNNGDPMEDTPVNGKHPLIINSREC